MIRYLYKQPKRKYKRDYSAIEAVMLVCMVISLGLLLAIIL